jgi:hypothetical protein
VFPVRYKLVSYILLRRNSVFKGIMNSDRSGKDLQGSHRPLIEILSRHLLGGTEEAHEKPVMLGVTTENRTEHLPNISLSYRYTNMLSLILSNENRNTTDLDLLASLCSASSVWIFTLVPCSVASCRCWCPLLADSGTLSRPCLVTRSWQ